MNHEGEDRVAWVRVKALEKRGGWKQETQDPSSGIRNRDIGHNAENWKQLATPSPAHERPLKCLPGQGKGYE